MITKDLERFMSKVEVTTGCWFWRGAMSDRQYGVFSVGPTAIAAHKAAFEHFIHPVPEELELDHVCRITYCVNPEHLRPVTHTENMARSRNTMRLTCKKGHDLANDFYVRRRDSGEGISKVCATCMREAQKRWRMENPEQARANNLKARQRRIAKRNISDNNPPQKSQ